MTQQALKFNKRRSWNKGKKLHNWGDVKKHRRRSNPAGTVVLLANPHKRKRKARKAKAHKPSTVRRRRVHVMKSNPSTPRRRRKRNVVSMVMKRHGIRRHRMRANPVELSSWTQVVGVFIAGGLGIIFARVVAAAYDDKISPTVLGDSGQLDPKSWRGILNEFMRAVVTGGVVVMVGRAAAKAKLPKGYSYAFMIGGGAEVARQTVGRGLRLLKPGTNLRRMGLDGPDEMVDDFGRSWVLNGEGRYELAEGGGQRMLAGVEEAEAFEGLETEDMFAGAGF